MQFLIRAFTWLLPLLFGLLCTLLTCLLIRLFPPKSKKGALGRALLCLVSLCILIFVLPPLSLSHYLSFSTPEEAGRYLYPNGHLLLQVEGEASLCLLYQEEDSFNFSPTIILRDGDTYRIPKESRNRSFTDPLENAELSPDGNYYNVSIFSAPECPDRYVYVSSQLKNSPHVKLLYPDGASFPSANFSTLSFHGVDYSILTAIAPLQRTDTGSCLLFIQNGELSFSIEFDPNADYFMK